MSLQMKKDNFINITFNMTSHQGKISYYFYFMSQPYAKTETEKRKTADEDEEIIYILQLPDWEFKCPVHNESVRTPRL